MQQTTNFQLSQWDADDRILRTDFNSDNAKIDAALRQISLDLEGKFSDLRGEVAAEASAQAEELAALAARKSLELIKTAVLETGGRYVSLPFGAMDWSQWKAVYFCFTLYLQESGYIDIDISGSTVTQLMGGGVTSDGTSIPISARLLVYPLYDAAAGVTALPIGGKGGDLVQAGTVFSSFTSFNLRAVASGNQVLAGCKCEIWGER